MPSMLPHELEPIRIRSMPSSSLDLDPLIRRPRSISGVCALRRDTFKALGDSRHAVQDVIAPRQQRGASRRAERYRVPRSVGDSVLGQLVERWHLDAAAVGGHAARPVSS